MKQEERRKHRLSDFPEPETTLPLGVFLVGIGLLVLVGMLCGCATAPPENATGAADAAKAAACPPLPVCKITPAASSSQLENDLWECVLEYRALYSVCYVMQHPAP